MAQPESLIKSPFAQAWLEALAREETKAMGAVKQPKLKRNGRQPFSPALVRGARANFIREAAELEAEDITTGAVVQFGDSSRVFDVRKPTVHIQPPGLLEEERRLRELPRKLTFSAHKLGDRWSKWIDRDRRDGWRHIDPVLENEWSNIMAGLTEVDTEVRPGILEAFVKATNVSVAQKAWDSKVIDLQTENKARYLHSYLVRLGEIRQDQGITFKAVGVVLIWFEHLSGILQNREIRNSYRTMIQNKTEESGELLTIEQICAVFGEWLDQPSVREYFRQRATSARKI